LQPPPDPGELGRRLMRMSLFIEMLEQGDRSKELATQMRLELDRIIEITRPVPSQRSNVGDDAPAETSGRR
jgi:hypothetical protein